MRFNILSHDDKLQIQKQLLTFIESLGGVGIFYTLLDDIREPKQHPLLNKTAKLHFKYGTISWGKSIFKEKIDTIFNVLKIVQDDNLLNIEDQKLKKQIINSIKTMGNLDFIIELKDNKIVTIKPFIQKSEDNIELDPIFQIVFFDSINNTKRILKYK